jgi:DNA-binding transcriptional MerR regulator
MRIGELAAKLGISTRMIRHYHDRGLLPEPARAANGYRQYGLADVVRLVRIRRLAAAGLPLREVAAAVGGTRDLAGLLADLDAELAADEAAIRAKRGRLAGLVARGVSDVDELSSPELTALLDAVHVRDRERGLAAVVEETGSARERRWMTEYFSAMAADPGAVARSDALIRELESLEDDDVRGGAELAARSVDDAAAFFPPELLDAMRGGRNNREAALTELGRQLDLPAAQRAYVVESVRLLLGREAARP